MLLAFAGWQVMLADFSANAQTNLVANGGFERAREGRAQSWTAETSPDAKGTFALDGQEKFEGAFSQKISQAENERAGVRVKQEAIPCRPNLIYRFDCAVKSNCKITVLVQAHSANKADKPLTFTVADGAFAEWTRQSKVIRTTDNAAHFTVLLAASSTGEAWFDAVSLVNVGEPPSLVVPRCETPIKSDGRLDEAAWQKAASARLAYLLAAKGAPPRQEAEALLTYDDSCLHIAFRCKEPNPAGMKRTQKTRGGNVWEDDCVEVFLSPEPAHGDARAAAPYFHFAANSLGIMAQTRRLPAQRWFTQWHDSGAKDEGLTKWDPRWSVKAVVGVNEWTAEIALPFSEIGRTPGFGETWTANFCRERKVEGDENSCWAYVDGGSFHSPAEFGRIIFGGGEVRKPAILAARPRKTPQPNVFPRPQDMKAMYSAFEFTPEVAIFVPPDKPGALTAAQFFKEDIALRGGYELQIMTEPKALKDLIIIDHEPLSDTTKKFMPTPPRKAAPVVTVPEQPEGYFLDVRPSMAVLAARDARGAWNGVQTLRQLVRFEDEGVRVSGVRVVDWPALALRGWHFCSVRAGDVAACRRLLDLFTLLKLNTVVIEVNGHMKYDRRPDLAGETALTKSQLGELVAYARERQFEVIPQVQTFGHFNYVLDKEAYKHLAENPQPDAKRGRYTYCPSNPDVYKLVFDMFDEVIEVFKPKYFHIGHDEITFSDIGRCERCKAKLPKDLLAEDVKKLYDYLAAKGLKVMMWCDQLEAERNGKAPWNTADALPLIPKDIIICDWHYGPEAEFPSLRFFKDKGFPVIACGSYKPKNIYHFTRAAAEANVMGYCATSWCTVARVRELAEMMTNVMLSAQYAWSPGIPPLDQTPCPPTDAFRRLYDFGAKEDAVKEFFTVDLRQRCNADLRDTAQRTGWFGLGPDYDMSQMSYGTMWLASSAGGRETPFEIISPGRFRNASCILLAREDSPKDGPPDRAWQIEIGEKAQSLYFLHTTSSPKVREIDVNARYKSGAVKVGAYEITYEDGSREQADLLYGVNIADWNTRLGTSEADIVWRGKTRSGALIQVCAYEWKNPKPDLVIRAVDFASARSEVSPVLIAITGKR